MDSSSFENDINSDYHLVFIFTGTDDNHYNHSITHHWIVLYKNYYFDPYSRDYNLDFNKIKLQPKQIEEYGATVCGEYAVLFALFAQSFTGNIADVGIKFCDYYGFTNDLKKNDMICLAEYKSKK